MELIIEITFRNAIELRVTAYGKEAKYLNPTMTFKYINEREPLAIIRSYEDTKNDYRVELKTPAYGSGVFK